MSYNQNNPWGVPEVGETSTKNVQIPSVQAPSAPGVAPREPGLGEIIGTDYVTRNADSFLDDTVTPWLQDAGTDALAYGKDALGMNVAGAAPGAVTSGVATAAEAGIANSLGTGIASGAGATGAAATGAAAAGGGAMAGLMAAAPYTAAAYGLYRLLK